VETVKTYGGANLKKSKKGGGKKLRDQKWGRKKNKIGKKMGEGKHLQPLSKKKKRG